MSSFSSFFLSQHVVGDWWKANINQISLSPSSTIKGKGELQVGEEEAGAEEDYAASSLWELPEVSLQISFLKTINELK